ncbi:epoxyqueuosine reductase QueH [uncultured Desulfobacter sp.]|uniref:epoxyqueuosine reductase QueH n=1 Tax=uncultured Desulfobacter sp. TaxID=240139 RepID=UPI0029F5C3B7|nr:epoxyqueuosine reductase QueH [uncultured Desulfobacter sp.]
MKVLLHTCCGPCTIYPLEVLRRMDMEVMGYFYRHNIHPFTECLRREETLRDYADQVKLKMVWQKGYELEDFLRAVTFREKNRCRYCYHARLKASALVAKKGKFDGFSTTLLYSKFQNHQMITEIGQNLAKQYGLKFIYQDFREGWKQGIESSKSLGMYRQQYCGCIYSEKDRFYQQKNKS